MTSDATTLERFLATHHPFDMLGEGARAEAASAIEALDLDAGATVYAHGERVDGLYAIASGAVEVTAGDGAAISRLGLGECFGERGLMRDGRAPVTVTMHEDGRLYRLPAAVFSAVLLVTAIGSLAVRQLEWGLDFTGGTLVEVHYGDSADLDAIRDTLATGGYEGATVVSFGRARARR